MADDPKNYAESGGAMSLVLEVFKDNVTGGIQVSLSDLDENGGGSGYRIVGPKFLGDSSLLTKRTLDEHDVKSLQRMLAKATP